MASRERVFLHFGDGWKLVIGVVGLDAAKKLPQIFTRTEARVCTFLLHNIPTATKFSANFEGFDSVLRPILGRYQV